MRPSSNGYLLEQYRVAILKKRTKETLASSQSRRKLGRIKTLRVAYNGSKPLLDFGKPEQKSCNCGSSRRIAAVQAAARDYIARKAIERCSISGLWPARRGDLWLNSGPAYVELSGPFPERSGYKVNCRFKMLPGCLIPTLHKIFFSLTPRPPYLRFSPA